MTNITNRIVLILGLLGLFISLYLTYTKISGTSPQCNLLSGCETVEQSSYSEVYGIPVALFGALFYLGIIVATFIRVIKKYKEVISKLLLIATFIGFIYSMYLTYLEVYVIFAICIYCVASAIISTALFFLNLYENIVISKLRLRNNYE